MNDTVKTILDFADGGVSYKTERLPRVKIKQQSPMPSLTLLSIIAVTLVLIFCVFSAVQMLGIKSDVYRLRDERTEMRSDVDLLEGLYQTRCARMNITTDMAPPAE